ncbi:hypothetical protein ACEPPN_012320 [Leptodophora sp. 'Broadleaf-Isolate-01']
MPTRSREVALCKAYRRAQKRHHAPRYDILTLIERQYRPGHRIPDDENESQKDNQGNQDRRADDVYRTRREEAEEAEELECPSQREGNASDEGPDAEAAAGSKEESGHEIAWRSMANACTNTPPMPGSNPPTPFPLSLLVLAILSGK